MNSDAQSQSKKDSLLNVLKSSKEDTAKITLLLTIQKFYSTSNFDSSLYYLTLAKDLAQKLGTSEFDYPINNKYSIYYYFNNNYAKAIEFASKAKDVAEKKNDLILLARSNNNIAGIHNHFRNPKEAIKYLLICLDVSEKAKDSSTFASYNLTASETFGNLRQYETAIIYARKGIEYAKKYNEVNSEMIGYNNLSVCYSQMNKLDSAIEINKQQLELAKKEKGTVYINYALINLCYNNFRIGNTREATKYAEELKQYISSLPDKSMSSESNVAFAFGLIGQGKYDLASLELEKGIEVATAEKNNITLENLYNAYKILYYLQGKIKEAEFYTYKSDSIVTARNLEELNQYTRDLETKYETEKKETQIKLQKTELRQKNILNYLFAGSAIALLLISLLIVRNYRNRQKLQQAKIDELETEKQLTATEAVLKGEEQERTRLAKDLHDGLGGMLSGIKYSLNTMKGNLIMTPENAQAFERSIDMLDSSIMEMRRVAHNMMPEVLVKYGLDTALKDYCEEIERSGVVDISYHSIGMDKLPIDQTIAVTIYRIVQELVNNAIKHAAAKNVLVQAHLSESERLLAITVEDNGRGFDTATLSEAKGIGWSNIQNRVQFLKGRVDIKSSKDNGTSVLIEINM